jgi:hypothetical protein
VQIYGLIQNLFDQRYYSIGTFVNTAGFTSATPGGGNVPRAQRSANVRTGNAVYGLCRHPGKVLNDHPASA